MAAAADLVDFLDHTETHFPAVVLEDREHGAELFAREAMFLSDLVFLHDEKRLVWWNAEAGDLGDPRCRACDGLRRAMSFGIPVGFFEFGFFFIVDEVAA